MPPEATAAPAHRQLTGLRLEQRHCPDPCGAVEDDLIETPRECHAGSEQLAAPHPTVYCQSLEKKVKELEHTIDKLNKKIRDQRRELSDQRKELQRKEEIIQEYQRSTVLLQDRWRAEGWGENNSCCSDLGQSSCRISDCSFKMAHDLRLNDPAADLHTKQLASLAVTEARTAPQSVANPETLDIVIMKFKRHYESSRDNVRNSRLGKELTRINWDMTPGWANGALILVPGLTRKMLRDENYQDELIKGHVVCPAEHRGEVIKLMNDIVVPYVERAGRKPKEEDTIKIRQEQHEAGCRVAGVDKEEGRHSAIDEVAGADLEFNPVEKRTFLQISVPGPVTPRTDYTRSDDWQQSGPNPRIFAPPRDSRRVSARSNMPFSGQL